MELDEAGWEGLAFCAAILAALVATAAGLRMGRGAKTAGASGLASVGRLPEIWTLKKRAAGNTEYYFS